MNNIKRLQNNEYIYSVVTRIITILVGVIESVLIARYLGAELKGINSYIQSIASIGSIVVTFGMHQAYPYFRKKYGKEEYYQKYINVIIIIYALYFFTGGILFFVTKASFQIKALSFIIPLMGLCNVVSYVALIETPNIRNTWWTVISIINVCYILILMLFVKRSVLVALTILAFKDFLSCIIFGWMIKFKFRYVEGMGVAFKELLSFGFFPMLALLLTTLNYRIDVIMLKQYSFISDSLIGVYSIGILFSDKIVLIPDTLKGVLVSKLAKGASEAEVAKVCRLGLWSSIIICGGVLLIGKPIIQLLYGIEYEGAYSVVIITAIGVLAVSYFKLIAQYNIINKKQILNVEMLSVAVIIDVVLNSLLIPIWGINGAAVATSIAHFVCGTVFILYFSKKAKISVNKMILIQSEDVEYIRRIIKGGEKAE